MRTRAAFCFLLAVAAALISGCAAYGVRNPSDAGVTEMRPDERGLVAGSGRESQDIVSVAQKMAREILSTPEIANAKGVPRIVLLPIKNETRFPINKDIFLERIIALLNEKSAAKVRFLPGDLKQSGEVASNTDPHVNQFKGANFVLTGKLMGTPTRTSTATSDSVLYSFTLIDPNTGDFIWQKSHEINRQGLEEALYR